MCEVRPLHRVDGSFPGLKPRAQNGVRVSNLIDIKAMFNARERRDRKRLAEALTTPVH